MPLNEFVTFQIYNELAPAVELGLLLKENNVEYIMEDDSSSFDPSFSNSELIREFRIKLKKKDFERADLILQQFYKEDIAAVDKDYYLFNFTEAELIEIIVKRDEWGQFDFILAQKLLKERGKEIKPELVQVLRKQRIEDLSRTEGSQLTWIIAGYFMAILGGLLGVFIGWHLSTYKKTLPNGDRVYGYESNDRKHGNRIVLIGVIFFLFWVGVRIIFYYNNNYR